MHRIWFCFVLWHIYYNGLFNAKSFLNIYIKNIYVLVGFYGISTIVGYLIPNPLYIYIYIYIYCILFGWVLWHINHCTSFLGQIFFLNIY